MPLITRQHWIHTHNLQLSLYPPLSFKHYVKCHALFSPFWIFLLTLYGLLEWAQSQSCEIVCVLHGVLQTEFKVWWIATKTNCFAVSCLDSPWGPPGIETGNGDRTNIRYQLKCKLTPWSEALVIGLVLWLLVTASLTCPINLISNIQKEGGK